MKKQLPKLEICLKTKFWLDFFAEKISFEIGVFNTKRYLVFSDKKIWNLGEHKITASFVTSVRKTSEPRFSILPFFHFHMLPRLNIKQIDVFM